MPVTKGHSLSSFVPAVGYDMDEVDVEEDEYLPIPIPPLDVTPPTPTSSAGLMRRGGGRDEHVQQRSSFPPPPSPTPPSPFLMLLLNRSFNQIHLSSHPSSLVTRRWNSVVVYEYVLADFLWQTTTTPILPATVLLLALRTQYSVSCNRWWTACSFDVCRFK